MTLRVIHTSDWHLGHSLHEVSREYEHACFLEWLLDRVESEQADALLIAGDIFDVANPSAAAQRQWYGFLSEARHRFPKLDIVAIGGNHDSAARLEAPIELLDALDIHMVGRLPRTAEGQLDAERLVVPLHDASGQVGAWCVAVPFLRPTDLPNCSDADDPLIEGVRRVYAEALELAEERREDGQAVVGMGHCYMVAKDISLLSERKVLGGNQHALPVEVFGDRVDYVALGHLHLAHAVGGREHVRYSGSPLPLSMGEQDYPHQVRVVDFEDGYLHESRSLKIPRVVDLLRLPKEGPAPIEEVIPVLKALPDAGEEMPPYLEVRVRLNKPEAGLRAQVAEALEGRQARLVKLTVEYAGGGEGLFEGAPKKQLQDVDVEEAFVALHKSRHDSEPSEDLMACFRSIVEQVEGEASV